LTYTQYGLGQDQGSNLFVGSDGTIKRYTGLNFPVSQDAQNQIANAIGTIDTMMQSVPLDAPWTAPQAEEWDQISAGLFARQLATIPDAFAVVMANLTTIFGLSPFAVSLLHLLWDSHAAGGVEKFGPVVGGSVEFRIVGGTQQIPLEIARRIGKGAFLLNSPVRELNQDDTGVTVVSELATLRARRVIVAIPTCLSGFIRYNPILPSDRALLIQRTPQGSAMKIQLVYDRAFWRDAGLNGNSFAINGSIVPQTLDAGGPAGVNTPGILACFMDDDGPHSQRARPALLEAGGEPLQDHHPELCRIHLRGPRVGPRRLRQHAGTTRIDRLRLRPRAPRAVRADPLGGRRHRDHLVPVDRRRCAVRRAGGDRGRQRRPVKAPVSPVSSGGNGGGIWRGCRKRTCRTSGACRPCFRR
jgi:hypothetical protein